MYSFFSPQKVHSSEEDIDLCEKEDYEEEVAASEGTPTLRTPVKEFMGHSGVVMAADWLPGGDQVITASWDRTANLYDAETGELLQSLSGKLRHIANFFLSQLTSFLILKNIMFFAPMGRFQLELIYLYFPPSSHLVYLCFCPVGLSLL